MKKLLLILFSCFVSIAFCQTALPKFIEVTGFAENEIIADYLEISVNVREIDNLKKDSDFTQREKKVLDGLTQLGIAKEDIRVDNFGIYRYGMGNSSNRYSLSKTYIVKVRNLESINNFTISLLEAGANDVDIVKRVKNDLEKHKADAVKRAVENARTRAEQIATTLGFTVGQPIQVSELSEADPGPANTRYSSYSKFSATGAVHRSAPEYPGIDLGLEADFRKMKVSYRVIIQFEIVK